MPIRNRIHSSHHATDPAPQPTQGAIAVSFDLIAPIVLFYGLRSAGVGSLVALIIGGTAPAVNGILQAVRHRRLDTLAMTVLILLLVSSGVSVLSGSPRFLLAKDAVLTAAWAGWFFLSLRGRRPLTFRFTRALLEGRRVFDARSGSRVPPSTTSWDQLWQRVPRFRRLWQVTTVIWGTALLIDAALRVLMAYALPLDDVPALAGALWLVTLVLLQLVTNIYLWRAGLWTILRGDPPTPQADST